MFNLFVFYCDLTNFFNKLLRNLQFSMYGYEIQSKILIFEKLCHLYINNYKNQSDFIKNKYVLVFTFQINIAL